MVTEMGWKGVAYVKIKVWPGVSISGSLGLVATTWAQIEASLEVPLCYCALDRLGSL